MSKIIYLNHGRETIVDDKDYKYLSLYKWRYNTTGYATRTFRSISMSRVIMRASHGEYVDHINGDKLDNRRANLRIVTNKQNSWNQKNPILKTSVGVSLMPKTNRWRAYYSVGKKQIWIGSFPDKESAMRARDKEILKIHGEFSVTNMELQRRK